MSDFYDSLETRDSEQRLQAQFKSIKTQLHQARQQTPAYQTLLADVDLNKINNENDFASLPLTRKSALLELQKAEPPFGGFAALSSARLRIYLPHPDQFTNPVATVSISGALRAHYMRLAFALATLFIIVFPITLHQLGRWSKAALAHLAAR